MERVVGIKEDEAETKVSYFKGDDPSKWRTGVPTYEEVNLGEIYEGIEFRLKAYRDNKVSLSGIQPTESTFDKGGINDKNLLLV